MVEIIVSSKPVYILLLHYSITKQKSLLLLEFLYFFSFYCFFNMCFIFPFFFPAQKQTGCWFLLKLYQLPFCFLNNTYLLYCVFQCLT